MRLADNGEGARMSYEADANVTGPLAGVGQRLMGAAARRTTEQFLSALDERIVSGAPAPAAAAAEPGAAVVPAGAGGAGRRQGHRRQRARRLRARADRRRGRPLDRAPLNVRRRTRQNHARSVPREEGRWLSIARWWKIHGDGRTVAPGEVVRPDERLHMPYMLGLGGQHILAMFGATALVPVLTGFPVTTTIFFSGVGTIIFNLLTRNRVPSYTGSSFAFIAPVIAAKSGGARGGARRHRGRRRRALPGRPARRPRRATA